MAAGGTEPAEPLRLGAVFGRYRVDALVGRGGMGVVFRATDLSLQRPVALKVLSPELAADPAFQARFVRESRLAAAIEHPAIVPVYEAGAIGDTLYIAMRFVPGRDLGTILRIEAPVGLERTLALLRPIADALDAAHRRGLVHRDVKPANVLVEHDGVERPFLADFGLTRRVGDATATTRAGPLGTIDYVSPEQVGGGSVDGRTDQYGLACVVVHCLTGAPPFSRDSDASVLYAHVHAAPPRPSAFDPRLPAAVDHAVARALAKAPAERFPDCRSFLAALAGWGSRGRGARERTGAGRGRLRGGRAGGRVSGHGGPGGPRDRGPDRRSATTGRSRDRGRERRRARGGRDPPRRPARRPRREVRPPTTASTDGSSVRPGSGLAVRPGEVIVFASDVDGDYDLFSIDHTARRPRRLTSAPRDERSPAISPDGTTIAYVVGSEPRRDIWLMNADGTDARALITHPADDADPAWSSDGRSLAFASRRSDIGFDVFEIRDRGSGLDERNARNRTDRAAVEHHPSWAPDSRRLAIASNYRGGARDIFIIDSDDPSVLVRRTSTGDCDLNPVFSPVGGAVAFYRRPTQSTCTAGQGTADLYVIEPGRRERRPTDSAARNEQDPTWAPDGRALAYVAGPGDATELYSMTTDGRRTRRLLDGYVSVHEPDWGLKPVSEAPPEPSPAPLPDEGPGCVTAGARRSALRPASVVSLAPRRARS